MKKKHLINRLRELPFDKEQYWLAAGGAMVIYGFRNETCDIDLGCSPKLADELEKQGYQTTILKDGTRRIAYDEDIEIFENWLMDKVVLQDGFPVVSVDGLIAMKKNLGREKDYRDIEMINCMRREMSNVKIEIRRAAESDYEALAKIGREDMGYAEATSELVREKLQKALAKDYERVFVAVCDGAVAGFVHAEQYDVLYYPTMINILGLAVSGEYRRLGLATKLMAAVEDWAKETGVKEIRLNSGMGRKGAHEFYRQNGFTDEKEQMRFLKTLE